MIGCNQELFLSKNFSIYINSKLTVQTMFAKTQHKRKSENVLPHRQWRRAHYCEKLACWLADCLPVLLASRLITLTLRQVCSTLNVNLQILARVMENNFFRSSLYHCWFWYCCCCRCCSCCVLCTMLFTIQFSVFSFSSNFAAPRWATRSRCLSYVSDSVGFTTQLNQSVSQPVSEQVSLTREGNNWISVFHIIFQFSVLLRRHSLRHLSRRACVVCECACV